MEGTPTYTQDTIIEIPRDPQDDSRLVSDVACRIAKIDLDSAAADVDQRAEKFRNMIAAADWT